MSNHKLTPNPCTRFDNTIMLACTLWVWTPDHLLVNKISVDRLILHGMAKRQLQGCASLDKVCKRSRSLSEPHNTSSLLQLWNVPSRASPIGEKASAAAHMSTTTLRRNGDPNFQKASHSSTVPSIPLPAQAPKFRAKMQQTHPDHAGSTTLDLGLLPDEVLEMVLCQVNIHDLYFSCRLVCKRWNDVIMREKVGS